MAKTKRDSAKIKKILQKRGYKEGEPPRGKEVHHVVPVAFGGKDTTKNIKVIPKTKHKQIHKKRRARGKV